MRDASDDFGNELAKIKWKTWVLLTWGAMRDRVQDPHNTGSPIPVGGYTKSTSVGEAFGSRCRISGAPAGLNLSPRTEEIQEMVLYPHEY